MDLNSECDASITNPTNADHSNSLLKETEVKQ